MGKRSFSDIAEMGIHACKCYRNDHTMTVIHKLFGTLELPETVCTVGSRGVFDNRDQQPHLSWRRALHMLRVKVGAVEVLGLMLHVRWKVRSGCGGVC